MAVYAAQIEFRCDLEQDLKNFVLKALTMNRS
jgi:hypothetical protein